MKLLVINVHCSMKFDKDKKAFEFSASIRLTESVSYFFLYSLPIKKRSKNLTCPFNGIQLMAESLKMVSSARFSPSTVVHI